MKYSYCYVISAAATTAYFIGVFIPGVIDMASYGAVDNAAEGELAKALAEWTAANNAYQTSLNNLADAQATITDAECVIKNRGQFVSALNTFCTPAAQNTDLVSVLRVSYGLDPKNVPNSRSTQTGSDTYDDCYEVRDGETCDTDSNGKKSNCKPKYRKKCDYVPYSYEMVTTEIRGAMVEGSGSHTGMSCGRFSYALSVSSSNSFTDSDWSIDGYEHKWTRHFNYVRMIRSKSRTRTYRSTVQVDVQADSSSVTQPTSYSVNAANSNLAIAAGEIIAVIKKQCDALKGSIKPSVNYDNIVSTTSERLSALRDDIAAKKKALDAATTIKNDKQAKESSASANSSSSQSLWLPLILVPPVLICCFINSREASNRERNFSGVSTCDTEQPFACCEALFTQYKARRAAHTTATRPQTNASIPAADLEMQTAHSEPVEAAEMQATVVPPPPLAEALPDPSSRTLKQTPTAMVVV